MRLLIQRCAIGLSTALLLAPVADAAEVVWLTPPTDTARAARIAAQAGAELPPLDVEDLLRAEYRVDSEAEYATVSATLGEVRVFEAEFDGELVIMKNLAAVLDGVHIVRDDRDLDVLFSALAYQGFAVDRYFGDDADGDPRSENYITRLGDGVAVRPWANAAAIAPGRTVTAYEIAEAPQRVRFSETADRISQLPKSFLVPLGVPEGAELVVDGLRRTVGPSGSIRVAPGEHFIHVQRGDLVLFHERVALASGDRHEIDVPPPPKEWQGWLTSLQTKSPNSPPGELIRSLEALDNEVWVVAGERVWSVRSGSVAPVVLDEQPTSSTAAVPRFDLWLGAGWMGNPDFYYQDPRLPPTAATVNAITGAAGFAGSLPVGPLRVGMGFDALILTGEGHVMRYGSSSTRLVGFPHVFVEKFFLRLSVGWLSPHYGAMGLKIAYPIPGAAGFTVTGGVVGGLNLVPAGALDPGSTWSRSPVATGWLGVGWTFPRP